MSALERLQKKLYRKNESSSSSEPFALHPNAERGAEDWQEAREPAPLMVRKKTYTNTILVSAVIFFAVSVGISVFIFLGGGNIVSTRNVDISISGPVSVSAGEEAAFQILIENRNNVALEFSDLLIEYPEGTVVAGSPGESSLRVRRSVGTISSGNILKEAARATFFGSEGEEKKVQVTLEYRVQGSNAIFVVEKEYDVFISSSPIRLSVKNPEEIISGQPFDIEVTVASNAAEVIQNLLLAVDYPFGFSFVEANPKTSFGNDVWEVGDLAPHSERVIRIRGVLAGQDNDQKVFSVSVGISDSVGGRTIDVPYASLVPQVVVARPSLGVQLFLGGGSPDTYVAEHGVSASGDISWINNTPNKITNARIEVTFKGDTLNRQSVSSREGFYRSVDNTLVWDKETLPELAEISSGGSGGTTFSFAPLGIAQLAGAVFKNSTIELVVKVSGTRLLEDGGVSDITSSVTKQIKVNSAIGVNQKALHYVGAFTNTGPLPPEVEKETTYTVVWTFVNSSNNVSGGDVMATLPSYIRWTGNVSPSLERVSFNSADRSVRWDLGDVAPGVGITLPAREVSFQIGFLPSIAHVDLAPFLITEAVFSGVDDFTGRNVRAEARSLDIRLTADPQFKLGQDKVVQ